MYFPDNWDFFKVSLTFQKFPGFLESVNPVQISYKLLNLTEVYFLAVIQILFIPREPAEFRRGAAFTEKMFGLVESYSLMQVAAWIDVSALWPLR